MQSIKYVKIAFLSLFLFHATPLALSKESNCLIEKKTYDHFLQMNYTDFDQSVSGWRVYASQVCYHTAAALIDTYVSTHIGHLLNWERINLNWHSGQLYAFNDEMETAQLRMTAALYRQEALPDALISWNDYVYATLAFLSHDLEKLTYHRNQIAQSPLWNGKKTNLATVDRLVQYFGQSYAEAYLSN